MAIKLSDIAQVQAIVTPSGIECSIGFAYDDKIHIQKTLMNQSKEVNGALLEKEIQLVIEKGLRDWDLMDDNGEKIPATYANVKRLPAVDGSFIKDKLSELVFPTPPTDEDKKK